MGLFGDLVKGALGGFPTIPDAPTPAFVDPSQSQLDSVHGNQQALPSLETLGEGVNSYNLQQRAKALGAIPGFTDISTTGSNLLDSQLHGELPSDVTSQVNRRANAKAYAGGYGGTGSGDNLSARDLGLTSLDLTRQGQAAAPSWLSMLNSIAVPPQFDVQSGFLSPTQRIASDQWNETNRFNTQWLQNQLNSIPDPETAAIAGDVGAITDVVATAALAWAGGALGAAAGGAAGAAIGGQLGGAIGGGGGAGGAASQFGGTIGSLMGGGGSTGGASVATTPNWGQFYPGGQGGYIPSVQQVNPLGSGSSNVYNPNADIYSLGGYSYGG